MKAAYAAVAMPGSRISRRRSRGTWITTSSGMIPQLITSDQKTAHGRTVIGTVGDQTHVIVLWWGEKTTNYMKCTATLDAPVAAAAPAFAKACSMVAIDGG